MTYSPTNISTAAASVVPWENAKPITYKWVSPSGSSTGNGTSTNPFKTVQAAVSSAQPGDGIMVKAGTYTENVKISASGTTSAPIWIASADGEGAATIKAANTGISLVYGHGIDNVVLKGFNLAGGTEGVMFSQGGSNLSNMATNLVVEQNHVYGQTKDGIKTAQTVGVAITGNEVHNIAREEGIDNVYMRNGIIANNEVYDVRGLSGIVAKAGSQNIKILNNDVHGTPDGILVGGFSTGQGSTFPSGITYQAKGFTVEDNKVAVAKQAVNAYGAVDSVIRDNSLTSSGWNVSVGKDNLGYVSKGVQVIDNDISKSGWLNAASGAVSVNSGNTTSTATNLSQLGPDALQMAGSIQPPSSGGSTTPITTVKLDSVIHDWRDGAATTRTIKGTTGADNLTGSTGHDLIDGLTGIDRMAGGLGDDRYVVGSRYDVVTEASGQGRDTILLWDSVYTMPANVENLTIHRSAGARVVDNGLDNVLTAGAGADTFTNNGGHDLIRGFKVGVDHIDLSTSATVARTAANDIVIQHGTASVTLVGVDYHTDLGSIVV